MNHYIAPSEDEHWQEAEYLPFQPEPQYSDYARITPLERMAEVAICAGVIALVILLVAAAIMTHSKEAWHWLGISAVGIHTVVASSRGRARKQCPRCKGEKTIYRTDGTPMFCPDCNGEGEVEE